MINPRDLRLGNLVEHEVFGVVEVVAIYKHAIDVSKDGKTKEWFAGSIEKPIPLTSEWLIRFGFEETGIRTKSDGSTENGFVKGIMMVLKANENYYAAPYGFPNANIMHVHSLQNAFFALTQTELTLSNP